MKIYSSKSTRGLLLAGIWLGVASISASAGTKFVADANAKVTFNGPRRIFGLSGQVEFGDDCR